MKKVLLIDDDPITNFINKRVIENAGLAKEIVVALSGRQGLEILIEQSNNGRPFPDLIVLDINMPILNGFDFLDRLQKLNILKLVNRNITILSSSDRIEDKIRAREFGIHNYLVKPITADVLTHLLR